MEYIYPKRISFSFFSYSSQLHVTPNQCLNRDPSHLTCMASNKFVICKHTELTKKYSIKSLPLHKLFLFEFLVF